MNDALSIIYYIFNKFIKLIFDDFTLFTNVSLGWIMVSVVIIAIMISNILSVAKSSMTYSFYEHDKRKDIEILGYKEWSARRTR